MTREMADECAPIVPLVRKCTQLLETLIETLNLLNSLIDPGSHITAQPEPKGERIIDQLDFKITCCRVDASEIRRLVIGIGDRLGP